MKFIKPFMFIILIAFFLIFATCCNPAKKVRPIYSEKTTKYTQTSVNLKSITINSKILNKPMQINIFIPPNYNSRVKYPVLYLLPGSSGEQDFCMPELEIQNFANDLILKGEIHPLIIVSTEMDNSFGLNSSNIYKQIELSKKILHFGRYEDYLSKELVHYIDSHFSTINNRNGRYIGGISDGGYIALRTAFLHPYEYSKVGGHSPNLDHENPNSKIEDLYFPEKHKTNNKDIYYIAQNYDVSTLSIYLDCGNKDTHEFYIGCGKLNKILVSRNSDIQYHLNLGSHGKDYWESQIPSYLNFYAGQ